MNGYSLLSSILGGVWAIEPSVAHGYYPLVDSLLRGTTPTTSKIDQSEYIPTLIGASSVGRSGPNDGDEKFVQVLQVKGVITKYDQYCGPSGTETLSRRIKSASKNPQVAGVMLDFDTGGGEGYACQLPVQTIEETRLIKPIVSNVGNGHCGSAGYYMASPSDEIYATFKSDCIGSIGTYVTIADMIGYYKSKGLDILEIYASKSKNKNSPYLEALKGNPQSLITEILDPFNQDFLDTVMKHRGIDSSSVALTGKMFRAEEAEKEGLIDGFKSYDEMINRIFDLAENPELNLRNKRKSVTSSTPPKTQIKTVINNLFKPKTINKMDITKMKSKLSSTGEEPVALTAAESASLAAFLEATEKEGNVFTQTELDTAVNTAVTTAEEAKDKKISSLEESNSQLESKVETLEARPAADAIDLKGEGTQIEAADEDDFRCSVDMEREQLNQ
jgi:protease-4